MCKWEGGAPSPTFSPLVPCPAAHPWAKQTLPGQRLGARMVTLWAQTVTAPLDSGTGWARRRPITGERSLQEWPVAIRSVSFCSQSRVQVPALPLDSCVFMGN